MFGTKPDDAAEIVVEKFDREYSLIKTRTKPKNQKANTPAIIPHSDLAACHLANRTLLSATDNGKGTTVVAWRAASSDLIKVASLKPNGSFNKPVATEMKTRYKPALIAHNGFLVMVYTDAKTSNVDLAISFDGVNWTEYTLADSKKDKACSAPAIIRHRGAIVVSWLKEKDKLLKIIYAWPSAKSTTYMNGPKFSPKFQPVGDPALESGNGMLYLAFTTSAKQLQLLSASQGYYNQFSWNEELVGLPDSSYSPSLFFFNGRLICTRREN